ncbi:MAG: ATP-dependent DNA ligase [Rhodocyclaceae bacterium]|nr:ATP-dependent DNA ligase [Rhodocyclaceae bacterium]
MKRFAALYRALDASNRSSAKEAALAAYFADAAPADAAWALWLLCGERLPQPVPVRVLKAAAMQVNGLDEALFADCYEAVGDLAETIALLLPTGGADDGTPLDRWIAERVIPLRGLEPAEQTARLAVAWGQVDSADAFVLNKLLTGGLRVGVSKALALRGVAAASGVPATTLAARMTGGWTPSPQNWDALVSPADVQAGRGAQPYPFRLAHPLDGGPETLGSHADWLAEWKWDGIRGQVVRRESAHLWSRGDEDLDAAFPDLVADALRLPTGTVLDGEVLVAQTGADGGLVCATATTALDEAELPPVALAPFAALQRRLGRKSPGKALLASHPAVFLAFDLLELDGNDWRERPLGERRAAMEALLAAHARSSPQPRLFAAPVLATTDWAGAGTLRAAARDIGAEGLMLKRAASAYGSGRTRGDWWKWKLDPHSVDAVLVYAQAGHGRRAGLFTDYTFAVWDEGALVPFAKAYSGLSDAEIREVDRFVRRNTLETFGPVRQVRAELVFEIGFEGILPSRRHKAGVAVRFPRMLRWRQDKPAAEAGTLAELIALANAQGGTLEPDRVG